MNSLTVSIITATYNSASTVADTLVSVAGQSSPSIEHLIVDGLSNDDTLSIVSQFPHVAQVVSEKDKGIYDAMNKGIGLATGDIIGILNSDDFYASEDVISKVVKAFEENCSQCPERQTGESVSGRGEKTYVFPWPDKDKYLSLVKAPRRFRAEVVDKLSAYTHATGHAPTCKRAKGYHLIGFRLYDFYEVYQIYPRHILYRKSVGVNIAKY